MEKIEDVIYQYINKKATSNIFLQGISGLLGWPWTAAVDVGVLFTHYGPMLNQIRLLYGRSSMSSDAVKPIIQGCYKEIISDIVLDKLIGQIPIIGFAPNLICAKALTWRLGILFAMLSSRGESVDVENVEKATKLIREVFPQQSSLRFEKPSRNDLRILLKKVANIDVKSFNETMEYIGKKLNECPTISLADL